MRSIDVVGVTVAETRPPVDHTAEPDRKSFESLGRSGGVLAQRLASRATALNDAQDGIPKVLDVTLLEIASGEPVVERPRLADHRHVLHRLLGLETAPADLTASQTVAVVEDGLWTPAATNGRVGQQQPAVVRALIPTHPGRLPVGLLDHIAAALGTSRRRSSDLGQHRALVELVESPSAWLPRVLHGAGRERDRCQEAGIW